MDKFRGYNILLFVSCVVLILIIFVFLSLIYGTHRVDKCENTCEKQGGDYVGVYKTLCECLIDGSLEYHKPLSKIIIYDEDFTLCYKGDKILTTKETK